MNRILVEQSPSPMKLEVLGAEDWPLVIEQPGTIDRDNDETETSYIVEGSGEITSLDQEDAQSTVTFGPGDLVTILPGTRCRWTITEAVERHYANG